MTASRIQAQSDSSCINTQTFILDCREIENLIPDSILSKLCLGQPERIQALKLLEGISISAFEIRDFLDIKKGTRMNEIINETNPKVEKFWQSKLSLIPNISDRIENWCQINRQCSKKNKDSKEKCECKISIGFGETILSDTVEYLKNNHPYEIAKIVDKSKHDYWQKIGQVVIDWCIAENPIRA